MRIDLALTRLRFVKTRSRAQALTEGGHVRCNGARVTRSSHALAVGDVLTLPTPHGVSVIEILALPDRRGPPAEARSHYRELDQNRESAIAGV
jgi:ribosome-associated heat shock protein Hsp15